MAESLPVVDAKADPEDADHWRIWTARGLVVDDPEAISPRLTRLSTEATPHRALQGYNTRRTTGKRVSCASCGHSRNHFHGFIVELEGGHVALVGKECGERFFGEGAWARVSADHERAKRLAVHEARALPTAKALEKLIPRLEHWQTVLAPINDFMSDLWDDFHDLATELAIVAHAGGSLNRDVRKRVIKQDRQGNAYEAEEFQVRSFGVLPGAAAFMQRGLGDTLRQGISTLREAVGTLSSSESTYLEQAEAFKRANSVRSLMRDLHELQEDTVCLFVHAAWENIRVWANHDPNKESKYKFSRGKLKRSDWEYEYTLPIPLGSTFAPSPWPDINKDWPSI